MTHRLACPPAPGPLEGFAAQFDELFGTLAQRRGFREYLQGLLAPRERNKTLTALAGAEPVVGAQQPEVQRLQFFLSESTWDADAINARRLELLLADPAAAATDSPSSTAPPGKHHISASSRRVSSTRPSWSTAIATPKFTIPRLRHPAGGSSAG